MTYPKHNINLNITMQEHSMEGKSVAVDTAIELFENELKWDTEMNFRAVTIHFENNEEVADEEVKFEYFGALIKACPEFIYFLNKDQFKEVFFALFIEQKVRDKTQQTPDTRKLINFENYRLSKQFHNFILETLENMPAIYQAPADLVQIVYEEVKSAMNNEHFI